MVFQFRLQRLASFLLVILDDNWIEESWRWFRVSVRICRKIVLDIHLAQRYKAFWVLDKCLFEKWYD